jgi:hypothetical protein
MTRSRAGIERNDRVSPNQNGAPGIGLTRGALSSTSLRESQRGGRHNHPGHASDTARVGRIEEASNGEEVWNRTRLFRRLLLAETAHPNQHSAPSLGPISKTRASACGIQPTATHPLRGGKASKNSVRFNRFVNTPMWPFWPHRGILPMKGYLRCVALTFSNRPTLSVTTHCTPMT